MQQQSKATYNLTQTHTSKRRFNAFKILNAVIVKFINKTGSYHRPSHELSRYH